MRLDFDWHSNGQRTAVEFLSKPGDIAGHPCVPPDSFIVADSEVWRLWQDSFGGSADAVMAAGGFLLRAREERKSPRTVLEICGKLWKAGVRRDGTLLALGGGLTCDTAAFAASIWLRGVGLVLVPSTLLAMVDAALGGKTGVNFEGAKNQLGTFYPARLILVVPSLLDTLPPEEMVNGLAEALKTAVISDRALADLLRPPGERMDIPELVRRCLMHKGAIVSEDMRDSGTRRLLNLGHTLGHALESATDFDMSHGQAVGLGMAAAAHMARSVGGREGMFDEIREHLNRLGLPSTIPAGADCESIYEFIGRDKKAASGGTSWILPLDWENCLIETLEPALERRLVLGALQALVDR